MRLILLALALSLSLFGQNALLPPEIHKPYLDKNGNPLSGGKIYTCFAGTTCPGNPLPTYQDSGATIPNANPVILDYTGWAQIRLSSSSYKFVAVDRNGVQQWTLDNIKLTFPADVIPDPITDISSFITTRCAATKEAIIPAGTFTATATITPAAGCYIHGVGRGGPANNGASVISFTPTNAALFNIVNDNVRIEGLTLLQAGTPVAGSVGILQAGNGSGVTGAHGDWGKVVDVNIRNFWNGMKLMGSGGSYDLWRVEVDACKDDGIIALGSQGYWHDTVVTGNTGNGVTIGLAAAGGGIGPFQINTQTFGNGGWGELSTSQIFISGGNSYFNNDFGGEISLTAVPFQADSGYIKDAFIQFAGVSVSFGTNTTATGILLGTGSIAVVDNIHCFANQGNCITVNGSENLISHVKELGSGQGGVNNYGIQTGAGNNTISDSSFSRPVLLSGNNIVFRGNRIMANQAIPALELLSGVNFIVDGNFLSNNTGNAYKIDTGVTINAGTNTVTGTIVKNGTVSANQQTNF